MPSIFQASAKYLVMKMKMKQYNHMLQTVAYDFWPMDIATEKTQSSIKFDISYYKWLLLSYLFCAYVTCVFLLSLPFFYGNMVYPIPSVFPFSAENTVFFYEMACIWEWFCNSIVIYTITGFDYLMIILMNCAVAQFKILQDVLRHVCHGDPQKREYIYHTLQVQEQNGNSREVILLYKCVRHHLFLIK